MKEPKERILSVEDWDASTSHFINVYVNNTSSSYLLRLEQLLKSILQQIKDKKYQLSSRWYHHPLPHHQHLIDPSSIH